MLYGQEVLRNAEITIEKEKEKAGFSHLFLFFFLQHGKLRE